MSPRSVSRGLAAAFAAAACGAQANPYDCLIMPSQTVELRSAVEGVIEKIHVQRGDRVKAGQVLVQLESAAERSAVQLARSRSEAQGRLASAQNRLDYASKKVERTRQLQANAFLSAQASDEAEAERRITEAELRDARETREQAAYEYQHAQNLLERRILRSPFDGLVLDRMLNPGDLAEAGTGRKPILKLVQVEPLRVEAVLPLAAYGRIKLRSTADVVPEGLGGKHQAVVTVIDQVFDSASGTFGVRLDLPNASGKLPAGIRCKVDFPGLREQAARAARAAADK
ncbi:efflux RND transporter periplasmic adaptor subunit [Ramlibacter algicola]|uniref:Efflux RND transporter periplasmic adaptor subunit n=1 Tax=Ramlibacter algicola TaxID=2795217 RepID=A0A934Q664_9BURK|nr:efflux RND transporter periplasmic adaptor subunit [Ramlibacter algicola]MBK0394994.1 efflux RND transporter periplasmic adaptor subunit [Ramlibacter algicola]